MRPSKIGIVVSQGKMDKTVKVRIRNVNWNRHVSKYITSHRNMLVHDELNRCREGDVVRIQYVRPLSALKSWAVAEFMRLKGTSWEKYQLETPEEVKREEIQKLNEFEKLRQARAENRIELGDLQVNKLDKEIESLSEKIDTMSLEGKEARRILEEDPERANAILLESGNKGMTANKSVKRNLIRRFLEKNGLGEQSK